MCMVVDSTSSFC